MAIEFRESFDLPALPIPSALAGPLALHLARRIEEAGGREGAVEAAVRLILEQPAEPPSELARLRSLYRDAYTREELAGMTGNVFDSLGLG